MKTELLRLVKLHYKRENNQLHEHLSTAGRKSLTFNFENTATVKYPNITLTRMNLSTFPHVPFISFLFLHVVLYSHFQNITEFSAD